LLPYVNEEAFGIAELKDIEKAIIEGDQARKLVFDALSKSRQLINKYKTFSVLIYSYIKTSGNWENSKLCGNTTVFTQFRVFPISTSVDITLINTGKCFIFFYNIAQILGIRF
jgi:hypothetical protein